MVFLINQDGFYGINQLEQVNKIISQLILDYQQRYLSHLMVDFKKDVRQQQILKLN
tara:strand:- start:5761 stop:5928 length:168 start_codon:yes stop_codon:yes gene_type:complete